MWCLFKGVACIFRPGNTLVIPCTARLRHVDLRRKVEERWFEAPETDDIGETWKKLSRAVYCVTWIITKIPPPGTVTSDHTGPELPNMHGWTDHERALQSNFSRPSPNE